MLEADPKGGESVILSLPDLLGNLETDTITLLKKPLYRQGSEPAPILFTHDGRDAIRYYGRQFQHQLHGLDPAIRPDSDHLDAVMALETAINNPQHWRRVKLDAGDMLLINNLAALHGRTALSPHHNRLMYRYRYIR